MAVQKTVSIRGKDNVLKHFKKCNDPYWKLYNAADSKIPIQSLLNVSDTSKSYAFFSEILDSLDQNGVFVLDTFNQAAKKEVGMKFMNPETSTCFALSESANVILPGELPKKTMENSPASLKDHIDLIHTNARLSSECSMYQSRCAEYLEEINRLRAEVAQLEQDLEEAEDELDEMEEAEAEGVSGVPNIQSAIAKLVESHGAVLVENLFEKGVKGDPGKDKDETVGESEEEEEAEDEEPKVNGTTVMPPLTDIVTELQRHDKSFHKHLYKLMLIAQQKPATFKMIVLKIDTY